MKKDHFIKVAIDEIARGHYKPGQKFDSVREMSRRYNISHVTASVILGELAALGILISKERSGHFITTDQQILAKYSHNYKHRPPQRGDLLTHLVQTESAKEMIPLGTAATLTQLVPTKEILNALPSKSLYFQKSLSHYSYPPGNFDLRFNISRLMNELISPDDLILTNGASEGIYLALKEILNPGDSILISSPTFYGSINLLRSLKVNVIEVSAIKGEPNLKEIEKHLIKNKKIKAGVFQCNFANPSGITWKEKTKRDLVKIFSFHQRYIIEDDTYAQLGFSNRSVSSLFSFDKDKSTVFYNSSFSKTLGPGLRVGWIIPPKKIYEELLRSKLALSFSGATNNEILVLGLLKKKNFYQKHTEKITQIFQDNLQYTENRMMEFLKCPVKISKPEGAFSLWLELPVELDSFNVYSLLIEKNIAITPGIVYSTEDKYSNFIRINCAIEFTKKVKDAIEVIAEEINKELGLS